MTKEILIEQQPTHTPFVSTFVQTKFTSNILSLFSGPELFVEQVTLYTTLVDGAGRSKLTHRQVLTSGTNVAEPCLTVSYEKILNVMTSNSSIRKTVKNRSRGLRFYYS